MLTVGNHPAFAGGDVASMLLSFRWLWIAYALDILAWDIFFPMTALSAELALPGTAMETIGRRLLFLSAAISFVGVFGAFLGDMNVRNIGIVGYAVVYPLASGFLAFMFRTDRHTNGPTVSQG